MDCKEDVIVLVDDSDCKEDVIVIVDDNDCLLLHVKIMSDCPICLSTIVPRDRYFPVCSCTPFHKLCLDEWFKHDSKLKRCPVCRTKNSTKAISTAFRKIIGTKSPTMKKKPRKRKAKRKRAPVSARKRRKRH